MKWQRICQDCANSENGRLETICSDGDDGASEHIVDSLAVNLTVLRKGTKLCDCCRNRVSTFYEIPKGSLAMLLIDGWAGRVEVPVEIIRFTPKKAHIVLLEPATLPSVGRKSQGSTGLVPKTAIRIKKYA